MKITISVFGCFLNSLTLCSVISLNPVSQFQSATNVPKANSYISQRSDSTGIELKGSLKLINNENNDSDVRNDASPTSMHEDESSTNFERGSSLKNTFHIFKIRPGRSKNLHPNRLNEKSFYLNMPRFHKFNMFPPEIDYRSNKKELPFDLIYPVFHRRSHFSDYVRSFYHPYFHKNYGLRRTDKHFINKNHIIDTPMFDNQAYYYPEKSFSLSDSEDTFRPSYFLQNSRSDSRIKPFSLLQGDKDIDKPFPFDSAEEESSPEDKTLKAIPREVENTSDDSKKEMTDDIQQEIATKNYILPNNPIFQNTLVFDEVYTREIAEISPTITPDHKPSVGTSKKATNDGILLHKKEKIFDHTFIPDHSNKSDANLLASNRVYFERMPINMNSSWFVYVNCSREKCHVTNNTSDMELMNEGWILHNCTNRGCSEMYPKIESVQKFKGLILLVFSLCVLKIVAFWVVFYYCRRIKLTKDNTDEKGKSGDEDDMPDILFEKDESSTKYVPEETAGKQQHSALEDAAAINSTPLKDTIDDNSAETKKKTSITAPLAEVAKFPSRVWMPPVQRVSPCLLAPVRVEKESILIPKKCLEKKTPTIKYTGGKFSISTRKGHSNIPRLEKSLKDYSRNEVKKEHRNSEQENLKTIPLSEQTPNSEEVLLMNWDEEIPTNLTYPPGRIEKTPNWESTMGNECKSFISLDLND